MSKAPGNCGITLLIKEAKYSISRHIYGHFAEHLGSGIYGGLYVGEKSVIPNIHGIRLDVVEALKKLKIPNLRWPGGCFADTYHWNHGVGPKAHRPAIVNTWWGGNTEDNSFGTHDFLDLCELLGTEPFIAGNVGSGSVQELMDWVQYVNFEGGSPMSNLRKTNGRDKPWRVKYWGLGNEAWGCGGNMRAEYYADIYRQYATFMTDWSNSTQIFRVASGAQSSDYHWTEVLMRNIPHQLLEGVGLHHYSVIDWNNRGPSMEFSEEQYFKTMRAALLMGEIIQKHTAIMDRFDPEKKIALVVDEWGGWYNPDPGTNPGFLQQQNTMRDAMIAGVTLNIFNNHCHRVRMANLAQMINVLQSVIFADQNKIVLTPTYHVMHLYAEHQDSMSIPTEIQTPHYNHAGESLPAVSVSASLSKENMVYVSIVNIDAQTAHEITLNSEYEYVNCEASILTSDSVWDHNSFEKPNSIKPCFFDGVSISRQKISFFIPPFSIITLKMQLKPPF
jgi:alpha-L-arabinofuranosidase